MRISDQVEETQISSVGCTGNTGPSPHMGTSETNCLGAGRDGRKNPILSNSHPYAIKHRTILLFPSVKQKEGSYFEIKPLVAFLFFVLD